MKQVQHFYRGRGLLFDFGAATVDPGTEAYDPSPLKAYMAALGVPYFYEEQCIMEDAMAQNRCRGPVDARALWG
jgi:hypothetical protein